MIFPFECPVCGKMITQVAFSCKDYSVSGEVFDICTCNNCSFSSTQPQPSTLEIGKYYQTEEYISHSDTHKGIVNKLYHIIRKRNTKNKLKRVNQFSGRKGSLLDIGCGTGYFLSVCRQDGWNITGVEVSDIARNIAENRVGKNIFSSLDLLNPEEKKFDVITLWHVFEHLHDINASIQQIIRLLNIDGVLILALPNPESFDAKYYKEYWAAYDVPRHLSHFSPQSVKLLIRKYGMKVDAVIPMCFDAFYISMLSEQLKGSGKISTLFKGFWIGLKSNFMARKDRNYSSLIYVFSKENKGC